MMAVAKRWTSALPPGASWAFENEGQMLNDISDGAKGTILYWGAYVPYRVKV